jgi:hypothetical protein
MAPSLGWGVRGSEVGKLGLSPACSLRGLTMNKSGARCASNGRLLMRASLVSGDGYRSRSEWLAPTASTTRSTSFMRVTAGVRSPQDYAQASTDLGAIEDADAIAVAAARESHDAARVLGAKAFHRR